MFAPPVAKPQAKAAASSTNELALERSTLAGHGFGEGAVEHAHLLQQGIGNQAMLRLLAQRASGPAGSQPAYSPAKIRMLQRSIGNQAVLRLLAQRASVSEPGVQEKEADAAREAAPGVALDFSKIPVVAPDRTNQPQDPFPFGGPRLPGPIQAKLEIGHAKEAPERFSGRPWGLPTRDPNGMRSGEEIYTANDDGGILTDLDGGLPPGGVPSVAPRDNCSVSSDPAYSPSGTIPVTNSGGRKSASFTMAASFNTNAAEGKKPSCCEVWQFIKWDNAFHTWHGGPPHSGFPAGASPDTWIEDRDTANKRYGHRSDSFSDPVSGCVDEYKTGNTHNQLNGDTYCARDEPSGPAALTGQWQFRLDVVDTCFSPAPTIGNSSFITINW